MLAAWDRACRTVPRPAVAAVRTTTVVPSRARPIADERRILRRYRHEMRRTLRKTGKMGPMTVRAGLRAELLALVAVAGSIAAVLVWVGPQGTDLAAHAYQRAVYVQHGFAIWNNFWYAGRYSFVTYSLLYYPLAAVLGIRVLALASIAAAAFAFSTVVFHQWGAASRLSSRSFAVLWVGIVGAAAFPFALATSFALLALWALQERHRGRFALCAVLTLAASPLGFAFLCVVLAGVALGRRSLRD